MTTFTFAMAVLMGLAGSLHCAGMCGPIVLVMPFQALSGFGKWTGIFLYHFGRVSVYAVLGLSLHSFTSLFRPQWQQYISLILGGCLLISGLISFFSGRFRVRLPWSDFVAGRLGRFMGSPRFSTLFITGALNGLLPCGLVYMALSMAVTAGTALQAMTLMFAFGLGTVPMLVTLTVLKMRCSAFFPAFRKLVPAVVFCLGCLLLLRGLDLGIPWLSPEVEMEQGAVKASCCHKT
jgi:sulfite exporter TauE/SafE